MARFFGYGSLVNARTHGFQDTRAARLTGWRREWCTTRLRSVAFLSVQPCHDSFIQGLTAAVPDDDWQALDRREAAYLRHSVADQLSPPEALTQVYRVDPGHLIQTEEHEILLSYLDVVVQGFLQVFGPEGVAQFFTSTSGWSGTILDDRAAPRYSRHQPLSSKEVACVDSFVQDLPMAMRQLE